MCVIVLPLLFCRNDPLFQQQLCLVVAGASCPIILAGHTRSNRQQDSAASVRDAKVSAGNQD